MSASLPALVRSWRVGSRTATLTVSQPDINGQRSALIEWDGDVPKKLSPAELEQYRRGRDAAFKALGLSALVVEI